VFSINRAFGVGRDAKAFLSMQGGLTRGEVPNPKHDEEQAQRLRKIVTRQRKALRRKDQRIEEQAATLETLRERRQREIRLRKELKETRLEIFHLNNELDAMKALVENAGDGPSAEQVSGEPDIGSLPD
jgi:predicted RNase H-like nuclease (RuvC/YqgF family)